MDPIHVINVATSRTNSIVVYGDTTGFSTFARRNFDSPDRIGELSLKLFNAFFRYQAETMGSLKLKGDGFLSVHPITPENQRERVAFIMKATERLALESNEIIHKFDAPRPSLFRIRVAGGVVGHFLISVQMPASCANASCGRNQIEDWYGYPLVLGCRMLEMDRNEPLVCCQVVKEWAGPAQFQFTKLPEERRVPMGVFAEDVHDLFAYRSHAA